MKKRLILFAAMLMGYGLWAQAQLGMGTGRIKGTVCGETGEVLAGAKIKLENKSYKNTLTTTSDKKGRWSLVGLASGAYTITVTMDGYEDKTDQIDYREVTKQAFVWDIKLRAKGSHPEAAPNPLNRENEVLAALLESGKKLYAEKQYAKAVEIFSELLEKNPKVYPIYINIANCYREMPDYEKAIAAYQTYLDRLAADKGSISAEPVAGTVLSSMGEMAMAMGNTDKAGEYFKLAVETFPANEVLAYSIGEVFFKQNRAEQAIDYYKLALRAKETWAPPYLRLGYAYLNKGRYDDALASLKKFMELAPDDPQAPTVKNLLPELEKLVKKIPG